MKEWASQDDETVLGKGRKRSGPLGTVFKRIDKEDGRSGDKKE